MIRGRPNKGSLIHYQHPKHSRLEALCRNGSYHVKLTSSKKLVTCKSCKKEILNL